MSEKKNEPFRKRYFRKELGKFHNIRTESLSFSWNTNGKWSFWFFSIGFYSDKFKSWDFRVLFSDEIFEEFILKNGQIG